MQTGPPAAANTDSGGAASPGPGVVAPIRLVFERPLQPAQRVVIDRVRTLMQLHKFEVHDIQLGGETIQRIAVAAHVRDIELLYDEAAPGALLARFTVHSKQDRDVLVWTSSLFSQYVHYHVARIASINGAAHHMDWEAQQDPHAPERIKRWVEYGQSLIERLHRTER